MILLHSFALVKVSKPNRFSHRLLMFKNICRISIIFHRIIIIELICPLHAARWQVAERIGTDKIFSFPLSHHMFYPPTIVFILNHIPVVGQLMSQINPSTFPELKPEVCLRPERSTELTPKSQAEGSGLILSGTLDPVLKDGVGCCRSINPSRRLKFFLTFPHPSLHRSFQPTLLISSQSLEEGLFFSPSLLIDHLQC